MVGVPTQTSVPPFIVAVPVPPEPAVVRRRDPLSMVSPPE
jgi:hypothetical protein